MHSRDDHRMVGVSETSSPSAQARRASGSRGSEAFTDGFRVLVEPSYLADHSDPGLRQFVFAYKIRIVNESDDSAQLFARRWRIIDSGGEERVVEGEGVVGHQPFLRPGEGFEYSRYCPLPTPWGTMEGAYEMMREDGSMFEIGGSRFYLVADDGPVGGDE